MPFSLRFLAFASLLCACCPGAREVRAQNAPRASSAPPFSGAGAASGARIGAARALRLVDFAGKSLQGAVSDPQWETRGSGLFFTLDSGGTRNIWRAFPDPQDTSRYPRWRALPVTQFEAPLFARSAYPIEGDRAILMVSNAANVGNAPQATLFDLRKREVRALTSEPDGVSSAVPAPDAEGFAFATGEITSREGTSRGNAPRTGGSRRGAPRRVSAEFSSVWQQNFAAGSVSRQQVALKAWRPAWQGAGLLLVEGATNRIYRLLLDNDARPRRVVSTTQIALGSQIRASRDGSALVMAGREGDAGPLYLLAGDGSGVRALSGTEGAQSPAWSGDGRFLAFTAPLNGASMGAQSSARNEAALWILPFERGESADLLAVAGGVPSPLEADDLPLLESPLANASPAPQNRAAEGLTVAGARGAAPVARIESVQSARRGALAVFGTASGAGASATLEIGQGQNPKRWEARQVALSGAAGTPLLLWNPPASARGIWSFRLTVSGVGGAAQNLFSVILPLPLRLARATASAPTTKANSVKKPSGKAPFNASMPAGGLLPVAPLPDLPAPPLPSPAPLPRLLPAPPPRESAGESAPVRNTERSTPRATDFRDDGARDEAAPGAPQLAPGREMAPGSTGGSTGGRDAGVFNVSNTLAQMKAGQRVNVTFWALNRGARTWETGPSRADDGTPTLVRLVTRWVRFDNGNRNGWTYQNMKTPVPPGARARWNFDLVAPSQAGRYKLIYSLQRVAPGFTPPAYNAAQETWPDDFAAIAFAVAVKP